MFSPLPPRNATRKAVPTGTAEPVVATSFSGTEYVRVSADPGNTVPIYVSDSEVSTTNSLPLYAKDVVTYMGLSDAMLLHTITTATGQYLRIEVR